MLPRRHAATTLKLRNRHSPNKWTKIVQKNNQVQNETEMDIEFRSKQTDKQAEQYFIETGFYEKGIVSPN